ncbi:MAG: cytochrome c oxidase subunit II [Candidatus Eisenbacteria bacterium]
MLDLLIQFKDGSFWMPEQASTVAGGVDRLFDFILYISLFFFLLIVGLMVLFVIRYRRRKGVDAEKSATHHTALEVTWTVIPLILVGVIFYLGFVGYMNLATPPGNSYEVNVTAQKWSWMFTYPNGYVDQNLHAPVDVPVRLVMTSEDVIHSFFVPAFRVKKDVVPGRYSNVWFEATEPGEYDLFCAEYCGTSHSDMIAKVIVHPPGEFEIWLEQASDFLDRMSPAEAGAKLYAARGCKQCHTADGSSNIGPSFKGLYGRKGVFDDGTAYTAEENYLRQSILEPMAYIVAGYEAVMPTYQGRLKDREITAIIEYMKTLSE